MSADWRKQAAAVLEEASNDDIEAAFSKQAYSVIENKLGDLMGDQYKIGFEIVKKNDDNTRMVGIFAFRVEGSLLFAPVFFLNGTIKGPLLYRCNTKTFVPATKEWATFLIEAMETAEGKGRPIARRNESVPLVYMQRIAFRPPGVMKEASAGTVVECNCGCPGSQGRKDVPTSPTPGVTGAYELPTDVVKRLAGYSDQRLLSDGSSILKMAASDDGTITVELDGASYPMPTEMARAIREASGSKSATFHIPGQAEFVLEGDDVVRIKKAFFEEADRQAVDWMREWGATLLDRLEKPAGTLIRQFLAESEMGKQAAAALVEASAISPDFAEAMADHYPHADFIPETFDGMPKSASPSGGELALVYDPSAMDEFCKAAGTVPQEFFRDGFYVLDTRPEETMSVVTMETPSELSGPHDAGRYKLLMSDGTFKDVWMMRPMKGSICDSVWPSHSICLRDKLGQPDYDRRTTPWVIIGEDGMVVADEALGVFQEDLKTAWDKLDRTMGEGKTYAVVLDSGHIAGPVTVFKKTADGNVEYCLAAVHMEQSEYNWKESYIPSSDRHAGSITVTINPDMPKSRLEDGVFGADARFLEIPSESWKDEHDSGKRVKHLAGIGTLETMRQWLFDNFGVEQVDVWSRVLQDKKAAFVLEAAGKQSVQMPLPVAMVKLARDMGIKASQARDILQQAQDSGHASFFLHLGQEKAASRYRLADRPNLDDTFDSEFGVPLTPVKKFSLRVHGEQIMEPPPTLGDAMNPTTGDGLPNMTVATTSPEELTDLARIYRLPHVFEHGVVGTLANVFDSMRMIDAWIPKMEDGVDVLGRIMFLLYWRPDDFEKAYGSDDMINLEAEVESEFESLGSLLLKLLKKSANSKKDSVLIQNKEGELNS